MPTPEQKLARAGLGGAVNLNPSAADHSIRLTLFHPVASEADG